MNASICFGAGTALFQVELPVPLLQVLKICLRQLMPFFSHFTVLTFILH